MTRIDESCLMMCVCCRRMQARFAMYNIYWQCLKTMAKTALPYGEDVYRPRATEIIYLKPICDYYNETIFMLFYCIFIRRM